MDNQNELKNFLKHNRSIKFPNKLSKLEMYDLAMKHYKFDSFKCKKGSDNYNTVKKLCDDICDYNMEKKMEEDYKTATPSQKLWMEACKEYREKRGSKQYYFKKDTPEYYEIYDIFLEKINS